ncbi:hypothetical protein FRC12_008424 [Ceratobasidium sp. 428]|nr:hypothetical protein FRC12_008424 [Ceratobasidium sp. 428]
MRDHHAATNKEILLSESMEDYIRGYALLARTAGVKQLVQIQQDRDLHLSEGAFRILDSPYTSESGRRAAEGRLAEIYLQPPVAVDYERVTDVLIRTLGRQQLLSYELS